MEIAMTATNKVLTLLPEVLPRDPDKAIRGQELIRMLRERGLSEEEVGDDSLKSMFSTLKKMPDSPIARRASKQGYFLRPSFPIAATDPDIEPTDIATPVPLEQPTGTGRGEQAEEKFRSVYMAWLGREQQYPVHIEHLEASRTERGLNAWKFPDVISLRWAVATDDVSAAPVLNRSMLDVRRSLGEQPFQLMSAELKVEAHAGNLRRDFFQCLSNSKWAHKSALVYACEILDEALVDELTRLGNSFGVNVFTFNLTRDDLDKLPSAKDIDSAEQVETILGKSLEINTVVTASDRDSLDWEHLEDLRAQHHVVGKIFDWISRCMQDLRPTEFTKWAEYYGGKGGGSP
jgi:hypothetical protein